MTNTPFTSRIVQLNIIIAQALIVSIALNWNRCNIAFRHNLPSFTHSIYNLNGSQSVQFLMHPKRVGS